MLKILHSILLLLIFLSSTSLYAADDGDWWLQRQIQLQQNREDYARRVYGSARHTYDTVDPVTSKTKTITKIAIVEDVPSKQKLGKVLLERAKKFKGGIAGVLGGAAITAMIEAVGWVMEDGNYVKIKPVDESNPNCNEQYYTTPPGSSKRSCTVMGAGQFYCNALVENGTYASCQVTGFTNTSALYSYAWKSSPNTIKSSSVNTTKIVVTTPGTEQKFTLTDEQVGGIATGDYVDPVDSTKNITDNKYKPPVIDAYQHDPTGTGNDLAKEIDDRLKNAPPTPDGKPAPVGDSRYSTSPQQDKTTNDRSWNDDGSTATGDTTPITDPTTGEPTGGQSISLQFPIFCEWAHTMCKWYDDWKASDKLYKDHMTKTEEHQTQEKGFWQSAKDWFDWTKDYSELPDRDESDLNTTVDFEEKNISLNVSPLCPTPTFETITLHGVTSQVKTSDYTYICQLDWLIKPFTIGFATIMACFILFGFNRGSEE